MGSSECVPTFFPSSASLQETATTRQGHRRSPSGMAHLQQIPFVSLLGGVLRPSHCSRFRIGVAVDDQLCAHIDEPVLVDITCEQSYYSWFLWPSSIVSPPVDANTEARRCPACNDGVFSKTSVEHSPLVGFCRQGVSSGGPRRCLRLSRWCVAAVLATLHSLQKPSVRQRSFPPRSQSRQDETSVMS